MQFEVINKNGYDYIHLDQSSIIKSVSILMKSYPTLVDCFAVDFLEQHNYFSIYYQLLNYDVKKNIFVVTNIRKNKKAQSLIDLFENINWYEREIFDMFGIRFKGHPDLRHIFKPES
jgi:NADH:ubiquinone oxidoreductase subunit C